LQEVEKIQRAAQESHGWKKMKIPVGFFPWSPFGRVLSTLRDTVFLSPRLAGACSFWIFWFGSLFFLLLSYIFDLCL
jgi:hypothetical protein